MNNETFIKIINKKNRPIKGGLWFLQESNQGHMDFQSIALPTELRNHLVLYFVFEVVQK